MSKKIRILSIDGGGIKGILPGTILEYIESKICEKAGADKRLSDYFDLIAGTSTGGILSCIYLAPGENGRPKFTARQAVDLYVDKGHEIFDLGVWQKLQSGFGILNEKYPSENLEKNLKEYFGDLKLSQLLKPCLITSYEITKRAAFFFTSMDAKKSEVDNFYVRDICRATSAAPTYFETAKINSLFGAPFYLVDGGVFANNPALCAYAEAHKTEFGKILQDSGKPDKPTAKEMMIVSIGTGATGKSYSYKEAIDWGAIGWLMPIIDILMSGNSETVSYQLKQMFDTLSERDKKDYFRLEPSIEGAKSAMDNATTGNIQELVAAGRRFVTDHDEILNRIVERLIENE
ncbi:MAG TPA: patatin-like phospholipase family protein [Bacteroidales bacterium]|nr:patatin-like phospholipase family protein [Bacteroidales bacterium]